YGPIWPISIAPWQVHLCCMRADKAECKEAADKIYNELLKDNVEVIYDDRNVQAGVMFADADLLGVPVRVTIGPKNIANGQIEISTRDKSVKKLVNVEDANTEIKNLIAELFAEINNKVRDRI
ncbi:MAG: proline--tRNA ligase, partial [Lachnospiraceae bacterium]|nr:proline--tRNA ligase [Lachnospiraceae bacterium]